MGDKVLWNFVIENYLCEEWFNFVWGYFGKYFFIIDDFRRF